jgi:hypothetical protein
MSNHKRVQAPVKEEEEEKEDEEEDRFVSAEEHSYLEYIYVSS